MPMLIDRTALTRSTLSKSPLRRSLTRLIFFVKLVREIAPCVEIFKTACMRNAPLNSLKSSIRGVLALSRTTIARCSRPGKTQCLGTEQTHNNLIDCNANKKKKKNSSVAGVQAKLGFLFWPLPHLLSSLFFALIISHLFVKKSTF